MYQGKIFRILQDTDSLSLIRSTDMLYVYQLPCSSQLKPNNEWIVFPVYNGIQVNTHEPEMPSTQFGFPIVLAIKKKELTSIEDLYGKIVHHMERYCIIKLFEEDVSFKRRLEEKKSERSALFPIFQPPIHTTAAVTPAGGGPMVPMPNLFQIHLFEGKSKLQFPTKSDIQWINQEGDDLILEQGQGVFLEWSVSKAQQVFGSPSVSTPPSSFQHDYHSEINTEAWREYEELDCPTKSIGSVTTLEDCLHEFTGDEQLSHNDLWYCPRCKKNQPASKKIDLWKLPEILVIHLKRFSQVRRWGNKIDTLIDFPIRGLDMTHRVLGTDTEDSLLYDLYAVDNHYGGMGGGHCK